MLFNSYSFIFLFLPLTLGLHQLLRTVGTLAQQTLLLLASWLFYAWWDVRFLPLLLFQLPRILFAAMRSPIMSGETCCAARICSS